MIVTVQKAADNPATTGPEAKLAFAKSMFDREYADLIQYFEQSGWSGGDLRLGRWRHDCRDRAYSAPVEGRSTVR